MYNDSYLARNELKEPGREKTVLVVLVIIRLLFSINRLKGPYSNDIKVMQGVSWGVK